MTKLETDRPILRRHEEKDFADMLEYLSDAETCSIPERIFSLEQQMWDAAKNRDREAFLQVVSKSAVMVCGGYRCSGREYAEIIAEFDCKEYDIQDFEIAAMAPGMVQVRYQITLAVNDPQNADLAGTFQITTTWQRDGEGWKAVFNMDQRV